MIQPETFSFLLDLRDHNVKEWFDENRDRYKEARKNILKVVDHLIEGIIEFDQDLHGLLPKQCLFRINRDVRFSKNKDPYKTNFGASMAKGGKKMGLAGYYVNIDPLESFAGGGIYMPPSPHLKKIRAHIDLRGEELEEIIQSKNFRKVFGDIDRGQSLKTAPKGYPKDHPHIKLLRLKSFTAVRSISREEMNSEKMIETCLESFEALTPLVHFLNEALEKE